MYVHCKSVLLLKNKYNKLNPIAHTSCIFYRGFCIIFLIELDDYIFCEVHEKRQEENLTVTKDDDPHPRIFNETLYHRQKPKNKSKKNRRDKNVKYPGCPGYFHNFHKKTEFKTIFSAN